MEDRITGIVAVSFPEGSFLFSVDPISKAVAAWELAFFALFAVACSALFVCAKATADTLLVSPLEKMLSALLGAASILDSAGRVRGDAAARRLDFGQAISRVIAHLALSARGANFQGQRRNTAALSDDPGPDSGSILGDSPLQGAQSLPVTSLSSGLLKGLKGRAERPDGWGRSELMSQAREDVPKAASMRFMPAVLNHLGTSKWNPWLAGDELVSACHVMFIKSRIPETVCTRERFVAFAQGAIDKHPELRFHSRR